MIEILMLSLIVELAVVWVLRERTRIIKRVKLDRLLYVAGVSTILTQPLGWMLALDLSFRIGFPLALGVVQLVIIGVEAAFYRHMARIGWPKGILFSAVCNTLVGLLLLAIYVVKG